LGFGLAAGYDLSFGTGVDEVYGSPDAVIRRIRELVQGTGATTASTAVAVSELRKLRRVAQTDVATQLNVSKSAVAQMEKSGVRRMQVATLRKVIQSLGGELVLTASFPGGKQRRIAID
jgi:DNA-binding XRE family transcriptional regulator